VISYYVERSGDFLAVDRATNAYYWTNFGKDDVEGRATAIEGQLGSVCTTGISREFLRLNCRRIAKANVPAEWRRAIGL
jgi:hypothetical protein